MRTSEAAVELAQELGITPEQGERWMAIFPDHVSYENSVALLRAALELGGDPDQVIAAMLLDPWSLGRST